MSHIRNQNAMKAHHIPTHKTKVVCTIGPATESQEMLEQMIEAGMDIARLNFSHGDFQEHGEVIRRIRLASEKTGKNVAIMVDLPGPKIRIGNLVQEDVQLEPGALFMLTSKEILGDASQVSVTLPNLHLVVHPGDILFINDGLIQVKVERIEGEYVHCRVSALVRGLICLRLTWVSLHSPNMTEDVCSLLWNKG